MARKPKNNFSGGDFFSSFSNATKRKKQQKIVFWLLTVALGVGLVGSSMFWAFGGSDNLPNKSQTAGVQQQASPDQQIADLEAQIKKDPQNVKLLGELAGLYRDNGKAQQAVDTYLKALKIDSGNVDLQKELGITYFLLGKYDNAVAQMQETVQKEPGDAYAHYYLGQFYAYRSDEKRDADKGIKELEEFVRLQKEGPDVEKAKAHIEDLKKQLSNKK